MAPEDEGPVSSTPRNDLEFWTEVEDIFAAVLSVDLECYNFEPFYGTLDDDTLFELALAAQALHRDEDAAQLLARAREAGTLRILPARLA